MKNLILVGAGGFFLELYDYLQADVQALQHIRLKGVLDDATDCAQQLLPHLGAVADYEPQADDLFLITIGNVLHRKRCYDLLKQKGAAFYTYIHPTAIVARSAEVAEGCILAPYSVVNARALVAANVAVNVHCSIGHESTIGFSSVLSPYAAVNGNAKVGDLCFLGTRSTIFPGKSLGDKGIVDSHSYVKSDAPEKSIVSLRGDYLVVHNRLMR